MYDRPPLYFYPLIFTHAGQSSEALSFVFQEYKAVHLTDRSRGAVVMFVPDCYLPKMLSEDEIKAEIKKLGDNSIPVVMKHFKQNFNGKVDMRLVQEVLKGMQ